MRWGSPEASWWLVALGLLLVAYAVRLAWRSRRLASLGARQLVARLTATASLPRQVLRALLLLAGLGLLVVGLARPQLGGTAVNTRTAGIDVVFALDLSRSMEAKDLAPSRLGAARFLLESLLEKMGENRVALVPFAGIAYTQCPLTRDLSAIRVYLGDLRTDTIDRPGTAIGRALVEAVRLLGWRTKGEEEEPETAAGRRAQERVVVLITDGEDHESDPKEAAALAAKEGIRVFAVGMGSLSGEPIPQYHPDGSLMGYLKDRDGKFVVTQLDDETLRAVAEETRGLFLPYEPGGTTLDALARALAELEKTELESSVRRQYDERFQYALAPALLLLLLEAVMGDRVRRRRRRRR